MSPFFLPIVYTSVLPTQSKSAKLYEIIEKLVKYSESCTDHQSFPMTFLSFLLM